MQDGRELKELMAIIHRIESLAREKESFVPTVFTSSYRHNSNSINIANRTAYTYDNEENTHFANFRFSRPSYLRIFSFNSHFRKQVRVSSIHLTVCLSIPICIHKNITNHFLESTWLLAARQCLLTFDIVHSYSLSQT